MNCTDSIVKKLHESRINRVDESDYVCKSIVVDRQGVMEIVCYDKEYDEEFTKYIGQVEDPSALKNARLILKDPKFEVPKDIKNELIGTFGLEDFGFSIEESEDNKFVVIDNTVEGESETYRVLDMESAKKKVEELVASGSDESMIKITPLHPDKNSVEVDESAVSTWNYWEMPADHKGPWTHPHYFKDYGSDLIGLIYPPYEATSKFFSDMTHDDYVAELYDNLEVITLEDKSFNNLEDAKSWLDETAASTLESR